MLYQNNILKRKRLPCKIISVGNITVGGTGKTPMVIYFAKYLSQIGMRPLVISRGYKGKNENTGAVVSNGKIILMEVELAGDEPFMIAQALLSLNIPVIVGKSRYEAGLLAIRSFNPDIILLDDGFQHLKLERDLDLVLLDGERPFGNRFMIPRGTLREPVASLLRGDIIICTRIDKKESMNTFEPYLNISSIRVDRPVFKTVHVPYVFDVLQKGEQKRSRNSTDDIGLLANAKVIAFSGIADNSNFIEMIEKVPCDMKRFIPFPDHHHYSERDLKDIDDHAKVMNVDFIVTTEKDYVKIVNRILWSVDLIILGVKISFGDQEDHFNALIRKKLELSSNSYT